MVIKGRRRIQTEENGQNQKWKKVWFYSLLITLAAQFSVNLFIADFKISLAVTGLPLFFFLTEEFPLPEVTFFSAAGVFLSRAVMLWLRTGTQYGAASGVPAGFGQCLAAAFPETGFYICYGLLLFLYSRFLKQKEHFREWMMFPLLFIDYAANFTELFLRVQTEALNVKTQMGIFFIAILRFMVILAVLVSFDRYKLLLQQREHEERYRRLLVLISRLQGEMIWMKKNTALIEETMRVAYRLSEEIKSSGSDSRYAAEALSVAKDIHEIKKEYFVILRGISEALEEELVSDKMELLEMFSLLKDFLYRAAKESKKELSMSIRCEDTVYTDKQYILMSVFRNLLQNALEAEKNDRIEILLREHREGADYVFEVTDHGPGIKKEYLDEVFTPGFSTKIDYTTGEINRGLGLNLVQELVEEKLGGRITLNSQPGNTTFTITIPAGKIECP